MVQTKCGDIKKYINIAQRKFFEKTWEKICLSKMPLKNKIEPWFELLPGLT
jgi:hypothetical protein